VERLSAVDSVATMDDHSPPEPCVVVDDLQLAPLPSTADDTLRGFTPSRSSTSLRDPTAATGATDVPDRHVLAGKLEAFVSNVTKATPTPVLDIPPLRHRVDPVLIDAPPQLPSSEAFGLRRNLRQALDPLSVVKPAM
jgi:hypothetical protein